MKTRVRIVCATLLACLAIGLGMPAIGRASRIGIRTNQIIYQPGDSVDLTLLLGPTLMPTPLPALNRGDLYVQVTLPDGSILFLDQNAQFTPAARPFRPDLFVATPSQTEIFSFPIAPVLPQGTYTLLAFQVRTGSDPTNSANIISTGFPVGVAFIAPTSPVGRSVVIPLTSSISRVAVNPQTSAGSTAILTRSPSSVSLVNLVTNKVVVSIATSRLLDLDRDIGLNPATNVAVVPFRSTPPSVGIIDLSTTQITTVNLPPLPNPANPGEFVRISSIGIDVSRNRAVVGLFSNTASGRLESYSIINLAASTIISSVTINASTPIDSFVLGPTGTTLFGFGGVNAQTLVERNVATGDLIRSFSFGGFVLGKIALLPAQNKLVIGTIPLVAPSVFRGIGLTTLDLGTGTITSPIVLSGTGIFGDLVINPINNRAILLGCPDPPNCLASQVFTVNLATFAFSSRTIPGTALVVALDISRGALVLPVDTFLDVDQNVAVPVLARTGRLSVTVRALETGTPIAGATVAIQGTGLAQVTTPGVFTFNIPGGASFPEVPAGPQTVSVSAFGFSLATMAVTIQAGQTSQITISPSQQAPPGTITSLSANPSTAFFGQSVTFTVSGTGTCGSFTLNFGDGSSESNLTGTLPLTIMHNYNASGTFTATATGTQSCTGSASTVVSVSPPAGTITSLGANPSSPLVGQSVTFTVNGSGTCGSLTLTSGDGASTTLSGAFPLTTSHAYSSAGSFTATATGITSCTGSASTSVTVSPPPGAITSLKATSSTSLVGDLVTFTVSGTGTCGSLTLAFGDGASTTLSGAFPLTASHTYSTAGTFTATATGTMSCTGTATTSVFQFILGQRIMPTPVRVALEIVSGVARMALEIMSAVTAEASAEEIPRQADVPSATATLTGVVVSGVPSSLGAAAGTPEAVSTIAAKTGGGQGVALPDVTPPSCVPPNATPIPGATVALPSQGPPSEATTGSDGTFFLAQAPAGTVLVAVRAPGQNPTTQLATIEQGLENCIVVSLLPTLNPGAPTTTVTLNAGSFHPGGMLMLDRTLTPHGATPTQADEYLLGVLPDGRTLLSLVARPSGPPDIASGVVPYRTNFTVPASTDRVFQFTFGGGEPPGTYQAVGRLVRPSGNFLNPADWLNTTTTSFTFGP